jgi:PHS family inorganic phosphate transporter-like MFS transporter
MVGYVYWPHNLDSAGVPEVPSSVKTAMMCSTLASTMIGQVRKFSPVASPREALTETASKVTFGFAADVLGRRKMYGLELVIVIVGTLLFIMSSNGEQNSMSVAGWMIAWRAVSSDIVGQL